MDETIRAFTFKHSEESFLASLREHNIPLKEHPVILNQPMASGGVVEILTAIGAQSALPALAIVVVQWLKARRSRKVMLQTKDKQVIHLEGYSVEEVAELLKNVKSLTVIDTKP